MMAVLPKIAMAILMRFLTERFVSKMIVHGLGALAKSTENKVDDEIVRDVAEALGI